MTCEMKMARLTGIVCFQVWGQEQLKNPEIVQNTAQLEKIMHIVSEYAPNEVMPELEESILNYTGAYERAAILFGIYTADALRNTFTSGDRATA